MTSRITTPVWRARLVWVVRNRWPLAVGFVGGCYFTVGAAWVWSWFL